MVVRSDFSAKDGFEVSSIPIRTNPMKGSIVRLTDRGFGFIKPDGAEKDVFFHAKELVGVMFDELREGDVVSFEIADSPKGQSAVKVSRA
ncbi:MAG: hypothetical protein RLZZ234_617 [Candidatus Parcubacteria bacterium]